MENPLSEFLVVPAAKKKLMDRDYLLTCQEEGVQGQEILEFSNEVMAKFYSAALLIFERKQFQDAADAFIFLATLNSNNHEYWIGLGMAMQKMSEYEKAIDAYEMAAITELDNPVPYFYLAKCLFAIHDREAARHALEMAIEFAGDDPHYVELKQQAIAARKLIDKPPAI